jgi:hypothetical protein
MFFINLVPCLYIDFRTPQEQGKTNPSSETAEEIRSGNGLPFSDKQRDEEIARTSSPSRPWRADFWSIYMR